MFGKKNEAKVKEPSPNEILMNRIVGEVEQLSPGQNLTYKLPEFYWGGWAAFLICDLNPSYPEKGKKYILSTDKIADGKPAGAKNRLMDTNHPKDFAEWVAQRNGAYGLVERF